MTHTAVGQINLTVSTLVISSFPSMSKCAAHIFAASANSKQRPVHGNAMIARKLSNKSVDMDYHGVPPPSYEAEGDSKRKEFRQQDPQQFTITATGASSSERPGAIRDPLSYCDVER